VASLIDLVVVFIPFCVAAFAVTVIVEFVSAASQHDHWDVLLVVLPSALQATLGKLVFGLRVTDVPVNVCHSVLPRCGRWQSTAFRCPGDTGTCRTL